MADFPEKDKNEAGEEFSTIFSDPRAHREIKVKNKKNLPKILAGVLGLCLLIGSTVAVINLIPVLKDGDDSSSIDGNSIEVVRYENEDIASVSVNNAIGFTEFFSETNKSGDTETVIWKIRGLDAEVTSSTAIENVVDFVAEISAQRTVTQKTAEECGLNNPSVRVTVAPKEKEKYTLNLGVKSPDNMGYYLSLEGKEDIYLVDNELYEALNFELLDLASTKAISGFVNENGELDDYYSSGALANFDSLSIKGEGFGNDFQIIANTDKVISEYYGYVVKNPHRLADNYSAILTLYQNGITVDGAYSFDVSSQSIAKFGLDNPDLETTMYIKDKHITYKFALQEDGDYAVIGDSSKLIQRVSADTLIGVVGTRPENFYSEVVFITSIDNLNRFKITAEGKEYDFAVSSKETEDESGETVKTYSVSLNGKKIKTSDFQTLYEECISLEYKEFTAESTQAEPTLIFDVSLKDGSTARVEFTRASATRFNCRVNGVLLGKVTATSVNSIIKNAEKIS